MGKSFSSTLSPEQVQQQQGGMSAFAQFLQQQDPQARARQAISALQAQGYSLPQILGQQSGQNVQNIATGATPSSGLGDLFRKMPPVNMGGITPQANMTFAQAAQMSGEELPQELRAMANFQMTPENMKVYGDMLGKVASAKILSGNKSSDVAEQLKEAHNKVVQETAEKVLTKQNEDYQKRYPKGPTDLEEMTKKFLDKDISAQALSAIQDDFVKWTDIQRQLKDLAQQKAGTTANQGKSLQELFGF